MAEQDMVRKVSTLLRMEEATRDAYDAALGKLGTGKAAAPLQRFRQDHQQHAQELRQVVDQMGTRPVATDGAQTFTDTLIDSVAQAHGYDGVFSTLRVAEAAVQLQYEDILQSEMTGQSSQTIRKLAKDEAEHIDVLELATHGLAQV